MFEFLLDSIEAPAPLAATIGLVALMVLGLLVWLLGRKLAKPACVVSGLVLGGLAGYAAGQTLADQGAYVLPLVIGMGIAGALAAGLLFRLWMGLSGAAMLALVVPAAVVIWQGTPEAGPPGAGAPVEAEAEAAGAEQSAAADGEGDSDAEAAASTPLEPILEPLRTDDGPPGREQVVEAATAARDAAREAARTWYQEQVERLQAWWDELSPTGRWLVMIGGGVGALLGLILGLVGPNAMASLESALAGSILLLLPGRELADAYAPDVAGRLPHTPRALVVWLGLITLLGFLVQWTLFRRKTDK